MAIPLTATTRSRRMAGPRASLAASVSCRCLAPSPAQSSGWPSAGAVPRACFSYPGGGIATSMVSDRSEHGRLPKVVERLQCATTRHGRRVCRCELRLRGGLSLSRQQRDRCAGEKWGVRHVWTESHHLKPQWATTHPRSGTGGAGRIGRCRFLALVRIRYTRRLRHIRRRLPRVPVYPRGLLLTLLTVLL